jgi:hypothetical protein
MSRPYEQPLLPAPRVPDIKSWRDSPGVKIQTISEYFKNPSSKVNDKVFVIIPGHISVKTNKYVEENYIPLDKFIKAGVEQNIWGDFKDKGVLESSVNTLKVITM